MDKLVVCKCGKKLKNYKSKRCRKCYIKSIKGKSPKNIKLFVKCGQHFEKGCLPWNKGIPLSKQMSVEKNESRRMKIGKSISGNNPLCIKCHKEVHRC